MCDLVCVQCIIRSVHSINRVAPNYYSRWSTGEELGRALTLESTPLATQFVYEFKLKSKY